MPGANPNADRPLDPSRGFKRRNPKVVKSEVEAKKARDKIEAATPAALEAKDTKKK
jgi:hypothetical protein